MANRAMLQEVTVGGMRIGETIEEEIVTVTEIKTGEIETVEETEREIGIAEIETEITEIATETKEEIDREIEMTGAKVVTGIIAIDPEKETTEEIAAEPVIETEVETEQKRRIPKTTERGRTVRKTLLISGWKYQFPARINPVCCRG